ncbi:hypothetical protein HQN90_11075 [Paenibacillus alba]|uniref:hypothetical protein n=1 Tax=Paenibacillus alba TaxID=1197127 RepID=UPI001565678A|nr:hypothetical protein [Paenibacillus alba]NQX66669.1 hypothetical protein [Paenibacillus alba]
MEKEQIPDNVSIELRKKMENTWDTNLLHYWYPLSKCKRSDIIAFDADYIEDNRSKLDCIIMLLKEHGVDEIYEFFESGYDYKVQISELHPFYGYFNASTGGEGFWCSEKMDWIIYASHERTITIGGEWLIKELKLLWGDWKNHITWDTKN